MTGQISGFLFVFFLLLIKENTPSLVAFEIIFPFQNNIILDIKDEEILQMTVFSIWLVWGFFLLCCCLFFFLLCGFL